MTITFNLRKNFEKIILYGVIIFLAIMQLRTCNRESADAAKVKELNNLIASLNDTVRQYKNSDSNNVATISVLKTEKTNTFLAINSKDAEIQALQGVVSDYKKKLKQGSSVTNFTSKTEVKGKGKTTVADKDSVKEGNIVKIYPEYSDSLFNEWISYRARMNKDSSHFDLKITNKYSVIVGEEGKGKKAKSFVDVINYSPYSSTDTLRTYQVSIKKQRPKRFGIGFNTGITYNFATMRPAPYFGAGLSYNFIRF